MVRELARETARQLHLKADRAWCWRGRSVKLVDGTSLLNARQVSQQDLSDLYAQRWNVELDLRNIKTTMGTDVLRCQSPQMNEKQLWVHLLAYNVIRTLMVQAARQVGVNPRALSFKHTVQLWTQWEPQAWQRLGTRTICSS